MEFNIQRSILLAGIRKTLGIVEKKTTMPILNNVLIKAHDTGITIIATDIEITLVANYNAEILSEGEVTLSAKKLYEMMREIPEGIVHVKKGSGNLLTISCEKAVYRINSIPADDFPSVAEDGGALYFKINREELVNLIYKSFFAISTDDTRPNLTGAFFEVDRKDVNNIILRMVGTDGHRLAMVEYAVQGEFLTLDKGVIIPRKGLLEIKRLLEENTGDIFVGVHQGKCIVKGQNIFLKVNLIDAEFPDYRRVIPQEQGIVIKFEKDKVVHALKRVNVISSEGYGGLIISLKDNIMSLTSTDPDVGDASDEINVAYGGEDLTVGYNIEYLLNAIEVINEGEVRFEIGEGSKPSIIKGEGNNHYLCIVMPLKT